MAHFLHFRRVTVSIALVVVVGFLFVGAQPPVGQFILDNSLLQKLLPKLRKPRLMTMDDFGELDKRFFRQDGFSFVVEGDFDRDGTKDTAIAGKDEELNTFILLLAVGRGKPILKYFEYFPGNSQLSLQVVPKCHRGFDGIALVFTLRSDHGFYLVWDSKKYSHMNVCDSDKPEFWKGIENEKGG